MFAIIALSVVTPVVSAHRATDGAAVQALADFETYCARSRQLWRKSLCGPIIIVDRDTRRAVANARPPDGSFTRRGAVWFGVLPKDVGLANTSVQWGSRRWAEVLLPLPGEIAEQRVLLAHEAFHRIQPELGFKPAEGENGHLDSEHGRIYARLEIAALRSALAAARAGREWRPAARGALAYRDARVAAFPKSAEAEAALLANEGLAEYTGIRVGAPNERTRVALRRLDTASQRASLIRSFGYVVGPAYGLLLDRSGLSWRSAALRGVPLPDLLRKAIGARRAAAADLTAYEAPAIIVEERARAAEIRKRTDALTALLVTGPIVSFPFEKMQIEFDPNSLFALGQEGTVYSRGATIRDAWGELKVSGDLLIGPTWSFVKVPGPASESGNRISGPGWNATLAPGYRLVGGKRSSEQLVSRQR